jgi:hypothetical protein
MPDRDLTPEQERRLLNHRPPLYRLMDAGALADVIELLHQLDQLAARDARPPRYLVQLQGRRVNPDAPTEGLALVDAPSWDQLLHGPQQAQQLERSRPHGLTVLEITQRLEDQL